MEVDTERVWANTTCLLRCNSHTAFGLAFEAGSRADAAAGRRKQESKLLLGAEKQHESPLQLAVRGQQQQPALGQAAGWQAAPVQRAPLGNHPVTACAQPCAGCPPLSLPPQPRAGCTPPRGPT